MSGLFSPDVWASIKFFEDPIIVLVLIAHQDKPELTEIECAKYLHITVEMVRKKKRTLQYWKVLRITTDAAGRARCEIDHDRLNALIAGGAR